LGARLKIKVNAMKKFFASFLNAKTKARSDKPQIVDPRKILFSVPTLSEDIASLEPFSEKPGSKDFGFHEDEWCQIEFFPKSQLKTIQQILKEYKQFEQAHRAHQGWSAVYVRKVNRVPVFSSNQPIERLEKLLGTKAGDAPFLFTYGAISGRVKNGFTIPLGGKITLYGYIDGDNIPVLGADVGKDPDDSRLTEAFLKLNASDGLLLIDWRAQLLIVEASSDSEIEVWRP
jgi:hypothetical protein